MTDAEDKENWRVLLRETRDSRVVCTEAMRQYVGEYIRTGLMTMAQSQQLGEDLFLLGGLIRLFEQYNSPKFKQWITNEVNSIYETAGFAQKGYFRTDLRDGLMDIYNGNY